MLTLVPPPVRPPIPPPELVPLYKSAKPSPSAGGLLWVAVIFGALAFGVGNTLFQTRADRRCVASGGMVVLDDALEHVCARCDGTECGPGMATRCPGAPPNCVR